MRCSWGGQVGTPGEWPGKDVAEQFVCQPAGLRERGAERCSCSVSFCQLNLASTYWVSKMDVVGDVTLLLDFGEAVRGSVLELDFEFVPSAFAVQAASPGAVWRQIFATDSNVLKHVRIRWRRPTCSRVSSWSCRLRIPHWGT